SETPERTHEAVLMHLKRQGSMTVSELCNALDITAMAVRRHLTGLQKEGLVDSKMAKQSRGRPTYKYCLTDKAESLFPTGFQGLAIDLLDIINEQSGPRGVMDVLAKRNERQMKALLPRMENKNLREKVAEVAKIFTENGFMSEWQEVEDGKFLIFQRHCDVHSLASQYKQLCA